MRPSSLPGRSETPGEKVIKWIQAVCYVPEGGDVGKPVELRGWQQELIKQIYDNPAGTRRAIVSFGRKNGKSALSAFLLLAHLCGPRHKPNSQLFSAARSRDQAAILFSLAAKVVRMSPKLRDFVAIRDTRKELACPKLGTLYRALSADASTAYGLGPSFVVHDELGQVKGSRDELYEALETATAAQEQPLTIIISTQAPTDSDLLSTLIDDAKKEADPRVVLSLFTADPDADPFSEETIRQANPAFGDFQNAKEVLSMAEDARRMPSRENEYRNLILNQRIQRENPFISRSVWMDCAGPVLEDWRGLPVWGGLDLSETSDLTALVLVAPVQNERGDEELWHVKPTFWLPGEGLAEKSRADRVPYDLWASQGYLEAVPGTRSVEYEYVAEVLRQICDELDVRKIAFDRYNWKHLRPWLLKVGFDEQELEQRFEPFGQGTVSMSPALRTLENIVLNKRLRHGGHPVLTMCAQNAVVKPGTVSGTRKLGKKHASDRIDGMVSLAMALAVAETSTQGGGSINDFFASLDAA